MTYILLGITLVIVASTCVFLWVRKKKEATLKAEKDKNSPQNPKDIYPLW